MLGYCHKAVVCSLAAHFCGGAPRAAPAVLGTPLCVSYSAWCTRSRKTHVKLLDHEVVVMEPSRYFGPEGVVP